MISVFGITMGCVLAVLGMPFLKINLKKYLLMLKRTKLVPVAFLFMYTENYIFYCKTIILKTYSVPGFYTLPRHLITETPTNCHAIIIAL